MDKYITQLLGDLLSARQKRLAQKGDAASAEPLDNHLNRDLFDKILYKKFAKHIGIKKIAFPAVEQLDTSQLTQIVHGLERLMIAYSLDIDLPEGISMRAKYFYLLKVLDRDIAVNDFRMVRVWFGAF